MNEAIEMFDIDPSQAEIEWIRLFENTRLDTLEVVMAWLRFFVKEDPVVFGHFMAFGELFFQRACERGAKRAKVADTAYETAGKSNTACGHLTKKHYARGMCAACYRKDRAEKLRKEATEKAVSDAAQAANARSKTVRLKSPDARVHPDDLRPV